MEKGKEVLYLSQKDILNVRYPMKDIIPIMEEVFIEKSNRNIQMPPKIALHPYSDENFIHAMPAWIPSFNAAGLKWVAGYAKNYQHNLPYINGLVILSDPDTGVPLCIMDGVWITAQRTGAMTGLTVKYLANPDSKSVGILGCGVQGRATIEAITSVKDNVEHIYAYDVFPEAAQKYAAEIQAKYKIPVTVMNSICKVTQESDILVSCVAAVEDPRWGVIESSWLKKGALLAPLDSCVLYKPYAVETIKKRYTDDLGQWQHFKSGGFWYREVTTPPLELCDLIAGKIEGRTSPDEQIMAMNIGLALEDIALASKLYERALDQGLGRVLEL